MEWWQYLVVSVVTVSLGAFLGFWFNRLGIRNERAAIEDRQLRGAISAILAEVEVNEKIAKEPWTGKQLPFLIEMWNLYKPQVASLPGEARQELEELYIDIIRANTVVAQDLHKVGYGAGFLDNQYRDICSTIGDRSPQVADLLQGFLNKRTQHGK
jgi:hypothetical protein